MHVRNQEFFSHSILFKSKKMHNQKAYHFPQTAALALCHNSNQQYKRCRIENPVLAHCILLPSVTTNMVESD